MDSMDGMDGWYGNGTKPPSAACRSPVMQPAQCSRAEATSATTGLGGAHPIRVRGLCLLGTILASARRGRVIKRQC